MPLPPGTKLGPYEILGPIGAGGMGEVYRARDARLAREVAVKVLPASFAGDPDRLRRFEQEARATGQLNHPNILAVYDTGTFQGTPYVVAELLEGATLRDRMAGAALPVRKAVDYARQIAQGLAAAHHKGIVHRDLKPENLFVTHDGRVKILDFGLAKLTQPDRLTSDGDLTAALTGAPTHAQTGAGVVLGTAGYMSPEQVRGQTADHRSDIFSFGSILYEMLAGRRAFAGPSSVETMSAILKEEPPELARTGADIPPGLERIVQHCLEKSPDERFQSARDLAFQIEALSAITAPAGQSGAHAGGGLRSAAGVPILRRVWPAIAIALVAAALVAAWYAGRQTRPPATEAIYRQLTFRQGSISAARFTPDGGGIVYSAAWDGNQPELFTTQPGSPESRTLGLTSAEILSVSRSGEMALLLDSRYTLGWMRSGMLARAPLAGGVPRPIQANVHDADWAPDGQGLVVARSIDGKYRLEYPTGKVLYETTSWLSGPRFSQDGRHIAFIDHPSAGDDRGHIVVTDLAGKMKILTDDFSSTASLAWAPGGREIWFSAGRTGNVRAIYAVNLEGRQRLVEGAPADLAITDVSADGKVLVARNTARRGIIGKAPDEEIERDLSWLDWSRPADLSADGRWLLFEEQGQGGGPGYSVYLRNTDGSPAVRLASGSGAALSPDGQWAATLSVIEPGKIALVPRGAGETRTLTLPDFRIQRVVWLPDMTRLLFLGSRKVEQPRLYVMDIEGGAPRPISPEGIGFGPVVSPDGRQVAAPTAAGPPMNFPIDGGEPRPVPATRPGDIPTVWSADGGTLYVTTRATGGAQIDRIELASGRRIAVKTLMPADRAGLIDLGFVLLSADARAYVYSYRRVLSTLYLAEGLR